MDAEWNGLDAAWPAMCRGMKESFCALVHNAWSLLDTFKCFQPQEKPDGEGIYLEFPGFCRSGWAPRCVRCVMRCASDPPRPTNIRFIIRAPNELCHLCLITQEAQKRFSAIGGGSRVMDADEKAGCADERDGGGGNVHLSDALVTGLSGDRGRGVEGRGRVANKHIFMYGFPSAARSANPGLINSVKRSQSFFFFSRLTPGTHGPVMTFTSFEVKSGSRYSTLQ